MMRTWKAMALGLALGLGAAGGAAAEGFRATYEASVLGVVTLGQASLELSAGDGGYRSSATVRTAGLAALFDQTNITASSYGAYGERGVAWSGYNLSHAYARKFRRIAMRRSGARVSAEITPGYGNMGDPPATPAEQAGAFDPVSALFALGRSVGREQACSGNVRVFDGRQHYRLTLAARGTETFRGGGYSGPALVCMLRYTPISGFRMSAAERARIPSGTIWYSRPATGGIAAPLRLRIPTPLGDAQLTLRSFTATR